jgi:hypothetical protein
MNTRLIQAYSKVNRVDVPKPRHLTVLREDTIYKSKAQLSKAIKDTEDTFKTSVKGDSIRVTPSDKTSTSTREELVKKFEDTLRDINLVIKDILPKRVGASSMYPTYVVTDDSSTEYQIVLGGGAASNKGMKYERDVLKSLEEYFTKIDLGEDIDKPAFLAELEDKLDITFTGIKDGIDFDRKVKRPLDADGPEDKGEVIADLALKDEDGEVYYISLKDIGGITVANNGAAGMFSVDRKTKAVEFNREKSDIGKKVFEASGINEEGIKKVEQGLSDYLNEVDSEPGLEDIEDTTDLANIPLLKKLLKSAFDYGYIYVKRKTSGHEIIDLTTPEDLDEFIGDIEAVKVKYPYYRSEGNKRRKGVSVMIETENNLFSFDIRNASRGIIPKQINLVKLKSKSEFKVDAGNVAAAASSDQDVESTLQKYFI